MPLVAHTELPTFSKLSSVGHDVVPLERALKQDIRELHIGLLNMMPDAALQATEQQFMRLVGNCNQIAQFYVHPFTIPGLERSADTQAYINAYYSDFETVRDAGLDALIITGTNVANPSLEQEPFWEPLREIIDWAAESVTSVLCSCLATHAILKQLHGIDRIQMPTKRWGVYPHRVHDRTHPLTRDINTRCDVPHSRWNDIPIEALEAAGLSILLSGEVGAHMAVSKDQFRIVYFQGHPEYDVNSLLKEYKREVMRFALGELDEAPPFPDNYFSAESAELANTHIINVTAAKIARQPIPVFPEDQFAPLLDNTWGDTGKAIVNNWLGLVYRTTNLDRCQPFMDGIDPENPLGLLM